MRNTCSRLFNHTSYTRILELKRNGSSLLDAIKTTMDDKYFQQHRPLNRNECLELCIRAEVMCNTDRNEIYNALQKNPGNIFVVAGHAKENGEDYFNSISSK